MTINELLRRLEEAGTYAEDRRERWKAQHGGELVMQQQLKQTEDTKEPAFDPSIYDINKLWRENRRLAEELRKVRQDIRGLTEAVGYLRRQQPKSPKGKVPDSPTVIP